MWSRPVVPAYTPAYRRCELQGHFFQMQFLEKIVSVMNPNKARLPVRSFAKVVFNHHSAVSKTSFSQPISYSSSLSNYNKLNDVKTILLTSGKKILLSLFH